MTILLRDKIKPIKLLILDVDGVLTDGTFSLSAEGIESKRFHTQDGLGIKNLQNKGITVAIISSRHSTAVTLRMKELGVTHVHQGIKHKITAYQQVVDSLKLEAGQIAYMGDDLPDLPVMEQVGLSIAPANAVSAIKTYADWKTDRAGGNAAVREVADGILMIHEITQATV